MSCLVTSGFLLEVAAEGVCQVHSGLVRKAEKYPKNICHLIVEIVFFSFLEGLVAALRIPLSRNPLVSVLLLTSLFLVFCIYTDGHGTIVHQFYFHIGTKFAGTYFFT